MRDSRISVPKYRTRGIACCTIQGLEINLIFKSSAVQIQQDGEFAVHTFCLTLPEKIAQQSNELKPLEAMDIFP
jgi:hypothetical protein